MNFKKITASMMALSMTLTLAATPAHADLTDHGDFQVDETIYINMDYYGNTESVSVVKSVTPYEHYEQNYKDYGNYKSITNMSGSFQPTVSGSELNWSLPEGTEKFYFEGTLEEDAFTIPWDIDVTYQLNGVPVDPAGLAGADGLVEIRVQGEPNDRATDYIKNNMMLELIYLPDEDHTSYLKVDGSMVQTVGGMQVALYTVLPDNDFDVTFEVVSDSYESTGLQMIMQPVTVDTLDIVQTAKEAKDDMEDDMDLLYEGIDAALGAVIDMEDSLIGMQSALREMDYARDTFSDASDELNASMDISRQSLEQMSTSTANTQVHVQEAKETVAGAMDELEKTQATLKTMKADITAFSTSVSDVNKDISELEDWLESADKDTVALSKTLNALENDLEDLSKEGNAMDMDFLSDDTKALSNNLETLSHNLGHMASSPAATTESALMIQAMGPSLTSTVKLLDDMAFLLEETDELSDTAREVLYTMEDLTGDLQELTETISDGNSMAQEDLKKLHTTADAMLSLLDTTQVMMDDIDSLLTFTLEQEDKVQPALDDLNILIGSSSELMNSLSNSMTVLDNVSDLSRDSLDNGSDQLIANSIVLLDDTLKVLGNMSTIKEATAGLKEEMDEESDRLDDDLSFLYNMDPDAEKLSFTSLKNPSPNTLQIIMRTEEITLEEEEEIIVRLDTEVEESTTFWERVQNLFVALRVAISNIFSA